MTGDRLRPSSALDRGGGWLPAAPTPRSHPTAAGPAGGVLRRYVPNLINLDPVTGPDVNRVGVRSHPYGHGFVAAFDDISAEEWEQLARVLDAGIDDLSADQQALAVERASRRVGAELDARDEHHVRILWDELRAATLRALLERLVAKRELEVAGVGDSGYLLYRRLSGPRRP